MLPAPEFTPAAPPFAVTLRPPPDRLLVPPLVPTSPQFPPRLPPAPTVIVNAAAAVTDAEAFASTVPPAPPFELMQPVA